MSDRSALRPVRRALISVSDKTGIAELGHFLAEHSVEVLSTGGSAKALGKAGVEVIEVSHHTGFPEIMNGRVKTLHPMIHGGILANRDEAEHMAALDHHAIAPIDLVVVNLYPFKQTVYAGAGFKECIENIDIGGPTLIRAAAKNHGSVAVVTDPGDYARVMDDMHHNDGATGGGLRRELAAAAFAHTAAYDAAIAHWFAGQQDDAYPERLVISAERRQLLRYGENPHQSAAFYVGTEPRAGVASARQIQGKELSYNNLNDTDAAFELVAEFVADPAIAIIKHANPCGAALGTSLADAYSRALACDPLSAFGSVIAANRALDGETARLIAELFAEVVIAPDVDADARAVLAEKKNLRLLVTGAMPDPAERAPSLRALSGGYLLQDRDAAVVNEDALRVVTRRQPDEAEMADLRMAFTLAKHIKSNAIVYVKDRAAVGVGAGQMSRVDSARIAARKAAEAQAAAGESASRTAGSVAASDAFFPFADGLEAIIEAGATAVIQPGGSVRDDEVIAAADEVGIAMVFTGIRHFRH
jgi:phosphoribosylaminoimidazolecarboxamide formyltransferase/IMP cyclohydrolase